ncbi:phospholipase A [Vibrio sp. YIC-376]|uniref:phospholipase A n=1 Tax=Vibrio sp. YIC-376 TaxID=3136162 RepID=UPI00402A8EA9
MAICLALYSTSCLAEEMGSGQAEGGIAERFSQERDTMFNPFVITPHEMNYILPVLYSDDINQEAYSETDWYGKLKDVESKYQLSFKVPLSPKDLFFTDDRLFFAFTLRSWWQSYAGDISRPFRETNYQPEIFYLTPLASKFYGYDFYLGAGIKHSSNGQSGELSRSWNYVHSRLIAEKGNFAFRIKPWVRLSESAKDDDNPDLLDYMGHFEVGAIYKWEGLAFKFLGRNNFSEHHGYAEVGMTFPFIDHLKGYIQYSNGYGESLIDYNHSQQRIGIGVALTDMF